MNESGFIITVSVGFFCQWWVAFVLIFTCVPYNFVCLLLSFFNGHQSWDVKVIEIMTQMMLLSFLHEKKRIFLSPRINSSVTVLADINFVWVWNWSDDPVRIYQILNVLWIQPLTATDQMTSELQSPQLLSFVGFADCVQPHSSFTLLLNIQLLAISLVIRRHSRANNAESWILLWTATNAQLLAWHCLLFSTGLNGHLF